jgi:predicted ATPase
MASFDQYLRSVEVRWKAVRNADSYPFKLPAVAKLGRLEFHPSCTFLIGENGSGKSTLLEALAVSLDLQAEGGSRNFRFKTYDSHSDLWKYLDVERGVHAPNDRYFLRAETFYNVATEIERLDNDPEGGSGKVKRYYGGSLHSRSHGESFLALCMNRLGGQGLYFLDEPEAALSPSRQMSLLVRMNELARHGSQFVIATHSPIVMAFPSAWIYQLSGDGVERVVYEHTEHYQVTRDFLMNPSRMLRELLAADDE